MPKFMSVSVQQVHADFRLIENHELPLTYLDLFLSLKMSGQDTIGGKSDYFSLTLIWNLT